MGSQHSTVASSSAQGLSRAGTKESGLHSQKVASSRYRSRVTVQGHIGIDGYVPLDQKNKNAANDLLLGQCGKYYSSSSSVSAVKSNGASVVGVVTQNVGSVPCDYVDNANNRLPFSKQNGGHNVDDYKQSLIHSGEERSSEIIEHSVDTSNVCDLCKLYRPALSQKPPISAKKPKDKSAVGCRDKVQSGVYCQCRVAVENSHNESDTHRTQSSKKCFGTFSAARHWSSFHWRKRLRSGSSSSQARYTELPLPQPDFQELPASVKISNCFTVSDWSPAYLPEQNNCAATTAQRLGHVNESVEQFQVQQVSMVEDSAMLTYDDKDSGKASGSEAVSSNMSAAPTLIGCAARAPVAEADSFEEGSYNSSCSLNSGDLMLNSLNLSEPSFMCANTSVKPCMPVTGTIPPSDVSSSIRCRSWRRSCHRSPFSPDEPSAFSPNCQKQLQSFSEPVLSVGRVAKDRRLSREPVGMPQRVAQLSEKTPRGGKQIVGITSTPADDSFIDAPICRPLHDAVFNGCARKRPTSLPLRAPLLSSTRTDELFGCGHPKTTRDVPVDEAQGELASMRNCVVMDQEVYTGLVSDIVEYKRMLNQMQTLILMESRQHAEAVSLWQETVKEKDDIIVCLQHQLAVVSAKVPQ